MMKFNIQELPPTENEIQEERERLQTHWKSTLLKVVGGGGLFFVLSAAYWLTAGSRQGLAWQLDTIKELKFLLVIWSVATVGFSCKFATIDRSILKNFLWNLAATTALSFSVSNWIHNISKESLEFAAFYTLLLGPFWAGFVALAVTICLEEMFITSREKSEGLTPIQEESEICLKLLKTCSNDPDCDIYNLALVQQGRRPVQEEARAMVTWAEGRIERQCQEAERKKYQKACQELRSGKSLLQSLPQEG